MNWQLMSVSWQANNFSALPLLSVYLIKSVNIKGLCSHDYTEYLGLYALKICTQSCKAIVYIFSADNCNSVKNSYWWWSISTFRSISRDNFHSSEVSNNVLYGYLAVWKFTTKSSNKRLFLRSCSVACWEKRRYEIWRKPPSSDSYNK